MNRLDADALVAGGGPTGLAAAIRLALAGRRVRIIEPRPGVIDKPCGEGLMPGALAHLAALGVPAPDGLPFIGIRYRDAHDPERHADGDFPNAPGRGVRRTALHRALRARAGALGVEWIEARVTAVEQTADAVRVTADGPPLRARHLIAADGLHSPIRRLLALDRPIHGAAPRYGVRRHYRLPPWVDRVEVHWAAAAEAYVTPVAPDTVGVAFLFTRPGRFDDLLRRFPLLEARLDGAEPVTPARGAGPFRQRARRVVDGRILLAGDAAGYLDPLTGEGVALGLATAASAVDAILADRPARHARGWRRATRRYFALTAGLLTLARFGPTRRLIVPVARRAPFIFDLALALLAGHAPERALPAASPDPGPRDHAPAG